MSVLPVNSARHIQIDGVVAERLQGHEIRRDSSCKPLLESVFPDISKSWSAVPALALGNADLEKKAIADG